MKREAWVLSGVQTATVRVQEIAGQKDGCEQDKWDKADRDQPLNS